MLARKGVNTPTRPGCPLAAPTSCSVAVWSATKSLPPRFCTSSLKPPAVPRPRTGGGRKTGKADGIAHARRLQRQLCRLLDHGIGALQGGAIGQLHVHNQIALILGWNEACRHGGELPIRQ